MVYVLLLCIFIFFFFKQKTAYDMRISDWSSDVCSSDLYAVIAACRQIHELCRHDFAFGNDRPLNDPIHTHNGDLRPIDEGGRHNPPKWTQGSQRDR